MTSRDFCYWLQGWFEVESKGVDKRNILTSDQVNCVKAHLALVFKHEIDPQEVKDTGLSEESLSAIHNYGGNTPVIDPPFNPHTTLIRC